MQKNKNCNNLACSSKSTPVHNSRVLREGVISVGENFRISEYISEEIQKGIFLIEKCKYFNKALNLGFNNKFQNFEIILL